jgi:hypothetical protein
VERRSQSFVIDGANVKALYSEEGLDVRSLGQLRQARKISDVRFNPKLQLWQAIDRRTRKVIASDRSRKGCVRKEHQHYDRDISKGKFPWRRGRSSTG